MFLVCLEFAGDVLFLFKSAACKAHCCKQKLERAPKIISTTYTRACLKKAFCKMCVTICGRFCPDEGAVAGM